MTRRESLRVGQHQTGPLGPWPRGQQPARGLTPSTLCHGLSSTPQGAAGRTCPTCPEPSRPRAADCRLRGSPRRRRRPLLHPVGEDEFRRACTAFVGGPLSIPAHPQDYVRRSHHMDRLAEGHHYCYRLADPVVLSSAGGFETISTFVSLAPPCPSHLPPEGGLTLPLLERLRRSPFFRLVLALVRRWNCHHQRHHGVGLPPDGSAVRLPGPTLCRCARLRFLLQIPVQRHHDPRRPVAVESTRSRTAHPIQRRLPRRPSQPTVAAASMALPFQPTPSPFLLRLVEASDSRSGASCPRRHEDDPPCVAADSRKRKRSAPGLRRGPLLDDSDVAE